MNIITKFITLLFAVIFTIWLVRLYYKLYDKKTRYTTTKFNNISQFIINDMENNKVKNTYHIDNIIYDIKCNKDSYIIFKKDLTSINNKRELLKYTASVIKLANKVD